MRCLLPAACRSTCCPASRAAPHRGPGLTMLACRSSRGCRAVSCTTSPLRGLTACLGASRWVRTGGCKDGFRREKCVSDDGQSWRGAGEADSIRRRAGSVMAITMKWHAGAAACAERSLAVAPPALPPLPPRVPGPGPLHAPPRGAGQLGRKPGSSGNAGGGGRGWAGGPVVQAGQVCVCVGECGVDRWWGRRWLGPLSGAHMLRPACPPAFQQQQGQP